MLFKRVDADGVGHLYVREAKRAETIAFGYGRKVSTLLGFGSVGHVTTTQEQRTGSRTGNNPMSTYGTHTRRASNVSNRARDAPPVTDAASA